MKPGVQHGNIRSFIQHSDENWGIKTMIYASQFIFSVLCSMIIKEIHENTEYNFST